VRDELLENASSMTVSSARSSVKIEMRRLRAMRAPALAALFFFFRGRPGATHATRVDRAFEGDLLVLAGLEQHAGERTSWLTTTRSVR